MDVTKASADDRLLRTAVLWLLGLSAAAAPRTFAAAPVGVADEVVFGHVLGVCVLFVALLLRKVPAALAAGLAALLGLSASLLVFRDVMVEVAAGSLSTEAAGNVVLSTIVSIAGVVFIALGVRYALVISVATILAHVVLVFVVAGDQAGALLTDRGLAQSFRFGVTAVALFLVATVLSVARARERDAAERAREQAQARARGLELDRDVRRHLYAEAAHELKGPLGNIRGAAETLMVRAGALTPEQTQSMLEILQHGVDRLDRRLEELVHPEPERADDLPSLEGTADMLVQAAVDQVGGVVPTGLIEVVSTSDAVIRVVPAALEHVIENLLSNAVKYGETGRPVRIAVRDEAEGEVTVVVTSFGGGLSAQDQQRVFDRNYRSAVARDRAEGDGLGLFLVRRLVADWGGSITCEAGRSTTTFRFTIPTVVPAHQADQGDQPASTANSEQASQTEAPPT